MKDMLERAGGVVPPSLPPASRDDIAAVTVSFVTSWQEIDVALSPVFGSAGVAALGKRCLSLACVHHPWLATVSQDVHTPMDLQALEHLLARQGVAEAARASQTLLQTLRSLLATLVGTSLTERLLQPVRSMAGSHVSIFQEPTP